MKRLLIVFLVVCLALVATAQDKNEKVLPYDVLVRSAKIYLGQHDKDFDAAKERLTEAVENYDNPVEALYLLGQIYAEKGQYAKMMDAFGKFQAICSKAEEENDKDLKKRCHKDDMPKQIEKTKQAEVSRRWTSGQNNLRLADSLLKIVDTTSVDSVKTDFQDKISRLLDLSEGAFNEALIIQDTAPLWNNLGIIEKKRGNDSLALEKFERGYALDSTRSVAIFDMASIHFDRGEYEDAARYYGRFATLDSLNAKVAYVNQAMAYQNAHDLVGLKGALDNVLKLDPNDPEMRYQRGMYYIQRVNDASLRDSLEMLDSISQAEPKNQDAKKQFEALTSRREGLLNDAISDFKVATTENPKDDISWYWLGSAAFFLNDMEEATKAYEQCVQVNEKSKDCWCQLALIYARAKQPEKAKEANEKCETLH